MNTIYSLRDVAHLFDLKESRLRYWAQTGFINPSGRSSGRRAYTFSDLVEIKAAKGLLDGGIPLQRVRRTLKVLRAEMPDLASPLKALHIRSDGEELTVVEDGMTREALSGQLLLDFEVNDLDREVARVLRLEPRGHGTPPATIKSIEAVETIEKAPPRETELLPVETARTEEADSETPKSAYEWFLRGCHLDNDPEHVNLAASAYEEAIALDPGLAAAQTNLGNLRYEAGDHGAALHYYQAAVSLDPDQPEALYNLANIYEEEGDLDTAIAEYRRALKILPDFADAHFNLALTLEEVGGEKQAAEHFRRYLELTPDRIDTRSWRDLADRHLTRLNAAN